VLGKKSRDEQPAPRPVASVSTEPAQSVIAEGMRLVGDCETTGSLRISGTVEGTVRAAAVEVTATGCVRGDVKILDSANGSRRFVIAGRVEASVEADHVEVKATGSVLGGIVATHAVIDGSVEGGLVAKDRISLGGSAVVEGDVQTLRISLEDGGRINGRVSMGSPVSTPARAEKVAGPENGEAEDRADPAHEAAEDARAERGVLARAV